MKSLSVELIQVRSRLQAAEKKASEPPPLLLQLQEELTGMKVHVALQSMYCVVPPPTFYLSTVSLFF